MFAFGTVTILCLIWHSDRNPVCNNPVISLIFIDIYIICPLGSCSYCSKNLIWLWGLFFSPSCQWRENYSALEGGTFLSLWRNSTIFALRVVSKAFLWQDSLLCLSLMRPVCSTAPHCSLMSGAFRSLVGLQDWNNLPVLLCCFHDVNQEHREKQRFTALCGTCNHTQDRRVLHLKTPSIVMSQCTDLQYPSPQKGERTKWFSAAVSCSLMSFCCCLAHLLISLLLFCLVT